LVGSGGFGLSDVGFELLEEVDDSGEALGRDSHGRVLGNLNEGSHNRGHFLVEFVLDGGSEDLVELLGDLEEEVGVTVKGGLSVLELSDDVIGGSDVV